MVRARQPTIERAITLVEEETELLEAEAEAFERFLARLRDVGTSGPEATTGEGGCPVTLAAVLDAIQRQRERCLR